MIEVKLEKDTMLSDNIGTKYVSDITRDLDQMSNINKSGEDIFHHYMQYDDIDIANNIVVIRVPGGSLGYVKFDSNYIITKILIDTDYVVKTYSKDVNDEINKKYIGGKLILL